MMPFGLFLGVSCLVMGFKPEITKHTIKTTKYIQEENKEELKEMLLTTAEIHSEAVTTTAKAVKAGMSDTMYCKHCGQKIDSNSKFCKYCGKEIFLCDECQHTILVDGEVHDCDWCKTDCGGKCHRGITRY